MSPRSLYLVIVAAVLAASVGWVVRGTPPPPAPPPRVTAGSWTRFDNAARSYQNLPVPNDVQGETALLSGADARNVLTLPNNGSVRVAPGTAVVVRSASMLHLDDGRIYADVPGGLEISAHNFKLALRGAAVEVRAWKDKDGFKNTAARVWRGSALLQGGPGLKASARLKYGEEGATDDVRLHPTRTFEITAMDDWLRWARGETP